MSQIVNSDRWFWFSSGGALLTTCAVLALCSATFVHGEGYTTRPIVESVGILLVAGLIYVVSLARAIRNPPSLRFVLLVAILARLLLLPSTPIQEDDVYRYMWDGRVCAAGVNPYSFSPQEIEEARRSLEPRPAEDLAALDDLDRLSRRTASTQTIFSRINNRRYATIYSPVVQAIFGSFGISVPAGWPVALQVLCMKLFLSVFDVATIFLLLKLLRDTGQSTGLVLAYGWCPLVLKEVSNSGHMDAIPVAFLVAALIFLFQRRGFFAGLLLGLAIGAKVYAVLLLPLFLCRLGRRSAALCIVGCLIVLGGAHVAAGDGAGRFRQTLLEFALNWENHDAFFSWLQGAWRWIVASCGDFSVGFATFAFTHVGGVTTIRLGALEAQSTLAYMLALATVAVILSTCAIWATRRVAEKSPAEVIRRVFIVLACLFLLGPLGFPWYFLWCVPFLPFAQLRSWRLLVVILPIYYLRFWFYYHHESGVGGFERGVDIFDYVVVNLEFGLFFAVAGAELLWRRRQESISGCAIT